MASYTQECDCTVDTTNDTLIKGVLKPLILSVTTTPIFVRNIGKFFSQFNNIASVGPAFQCVAIFIYPNAGNPGNNGRGDLFGGGNLPAIAIGLTRTLTSSFTSSSSLLINRLYFILLSITQSFTNSIRKNSPINMTVVINTTSYFIRHFPLRIVASQQFLSSFGRGITRTLPISQINIAATNVILFGRFIVLDTVITASSLIKRSIFKVFPLVVITSTSYLFKNITKPLSIVSNTTISFITKQIAHSQLLLAQLASQVGLPFFNKGINKTISYGNSFGVTIAFNGLHNLILSATNSCLGVLLARLTLFKTFTTTINNIETLTKDVGKGLVAGLNSVNNFTTIKAFLMTMRSVVVPTTLLFKGMVILLVSGVNATLKNIATLFRTWGKSC